MGTGSDSSASAGSGGPDRAGGGGGGKKGGGGKRSSSKSSKSSKSSSSKSSSRSSSSGGGSSSPSTTQFPSAMELLPDANGEQQRAMDDFVRAPSRGKWLELVESMRREREEQWTELQVEKAFDVVAGLGGADAAASAADGGPDGAPPPARRPTNVNVGYVGDVRAPDPPERQFSAATQDTDECGGWTMHAKSLSRDEEEDDQVSEQLKSMLSHQYHAYNQASYNYGPDPDDDDEENAIGNTSSGGRRGMRLRKALRVDRHGTLKIFALGFLVGTIAIIAVSFTFDRTPSQEVKHLEQGLRDRYRHDFTEMEEIEEREMVDAIFCGPCPWNGSGDVTCEDRVVLDEEEHSLSEVQARLVNLEYCRKRPEVGRDELDGTFCGGCQWKEQVGFTCAMRVDYEMERYKLTEVESKLANLEHCRKPPVEEGDGEAMAEAASEAMEEAAPEAKEDTEVEAPKDDAEENPAQAEDDEKADEEPEWELSELNELWCGPCHWKNAKGIDCNKRVKWEMEKYGMTEVQAKVANLKHCTKPPEGEGEDGGR